MESQNDVWGTGDAPTWATTRLRLGQTIDPALQLFDPLALEKLLYTVTKECYEPYYQDGIKSLPRINLTAEESQQIQTIAVELKNNINQYQVDFITGAKSIDSEWSSYVSGLKSIGLDTLIEIYQAAFKRQYQ